MRRIVAVSVVLSLAAFAGCGNVESPDLEADAAPPGEPDAAPPGDVDAGATYDAPPVRRFALTASTAGSGIVTSDPAGIVCGDDCTEEYDETQSVTLTVLPGENAAFVGWSGDGCEGSAPTCTVTMSQARAITATFKVGYTLTVAKEGGGAGTVTSAPAGIDCGEVCQAGFDENTRVTLTAAHGANASFTGWSGDDNGCSDSSLTCAVTLDRARRVVATFIPRHRLTVVTQGTGSVTAKLAGGATSFVCPANTTCERDYDAGTVLALTAAVDTNTTAVFRDWSGACSGNGECRVEMTAPRAVTAAFPRTFNLSVTAVEGSVTIQVAGQPDASCSAGTCSYRLIDGTEVTLRAFAASDTRVFVNWSGACSGSATTCSVRVSATTTVTATYRESYITRAYASLTGRGSAYVRVSQNGATIGVCTHTQGLCEYRVNRGTVTFTPVGEGGAAFSCWTGLLSGCFSTANPYIVTAGPETPSGIAALGQFHGPP